jgi:hypothetical protein
MGLRDRVRASAERNLAKMEQDLQKPGRNPGNQHLYIVQSGRSSTLHLMRSRTPRGPRTTVNSQRSPAPTTREPQA